MHMLPSTVRTRTIIFEYLVTSVLIIIRDQKRMWYFLMSCKYFFLNKFKTVKENNIELYLVNIYHMPEIFRDVQYLFETWKNIHLCEC